MSEYTKGKPKGENFTGNRNNFTSEKYNELIFERMEREEHNEEKIKEKNKKYGSGKYTDEGIIARIYGEYLVDLSKLSESDRNSFEYGYYEAANRQLEIMIRDNKISDFIKSSINRTTKFEKEESVDLYMTDVLYQIGYRDSYDNNPKIKEISEIIKANPNYFEGYMAGIEEQNLSPKTK